VQIHPVTHAIIANSLGGEGMQVRLIAWRHLQPRHIDEQEALVLKILAGRTLDPRPGQQRGPSVSVTLGLPPRRFSISKGQLAGSCGQDWRIRVN
jgi:hypothetical protein